MNNLLIWPVIMPLIAGLIFILFRNHIRLQRIISLIVMVLVSGISIIIIGQIKNNGIQTLQLGGWQAPYGIGLVGDMFSMLLVLTSSIVSLCCLLFSFKTIGQGREKHYFYSLFLFLITGVNGSFLTGDLFNLYVFFEILLLASYVLVSLGGGKLQLRETMKYVIINVLSSAFFLIGIAYIYSLTGTLNLAHISVRIAEAGQDGFITTVALLFLLVFGIKAGLFLFYWLPGSYQVPPAAISALFAALLTKVGIYAIIRMFTLVFYHEPEITHTMIGVLAALTMILGGIGAIGYWDISRILTYNVIIGSGFILAGLATFTSFGLLGTVYYLVHDMITKALIFLIAGVIIYLTGTRNIKEMSGLIRNHPYLGWMFFIAALALIGIPPLSGFIGKVFITRGSFEAEYYWLGAIGLITSLMILYSLMKIFMNVFWGETILSEDEEKGSTKGLILPLVLLTALTIALGIGPEWIHSYVEIAVDGLMDPEVYIEAVFAGNDIP
ncbi:Na+/H+ antiporter subunit D [Ornithinibacillus bavariensis]|uniref:Na+/H+ antiporter subunit D n=1 Tax=Ornithinibacillus bavariensis TaxID=545502 RepID=A0A919X430_9BACI|nr:Na+/H+ antiporter subunit D [Ornithinibacillus bavariensis]GIO25472.1 Na+/H+ antiporter subunit D [Ornithinibacillus bavariensis]